MVLDERIQIPHYAVGWGESCSALRSWAFSVLYGGTILERESKGLQKKSEGVTLMALVYMLLVSRQVPVSQQYWRKRIGPSLALAHRSRVELVLLPRLSLTRLSRTQSLFLFCLENHSFFTLLLLPAGSAATKVHIII